MNSMRQKRDMKQVPYAEPTNLGATVQNLVARATRRPRFVHPVLLITIKYNCNGRVGLFPFKTGFR